MGKTMATEPEDEKDPKKARVVLSKGCEVVEPGHSRLIGAVAKVTDRGENSGNSSRVNQFSKTEQHYLSQVSRVGRVNQDSNTDQQEDWIGWVSQDNSMDRQANRVSQVSQNNSTDRRADRVSRLTGLAVLATRSKK
jgi:hypothetical protein